MKLYYAEIAVRKGNWVTFYQYAQMAESPEAAEECLSGRALELGGMVYVDPAPMKDDRMLLDETKRPLSYHKDIENHRTKTPDIV